MTAATPSPHPAKRQKTDMDNGDGSYLVNITGEWKKVKTPLCDDLQFSHMATLGLSRVKVRHPRSIANFLLF